MASHPGAMTGKLVEGNGFDPPSLASRGVAGASLRVTRERAHHEGIKSSLLSANSVDRDLPGEPVTVISPEPQG